MNTFRLVLVLTLLLSALAITATAHAHPNLPGYCQMPDGTLNPGHCTDADSAAGGHDVHLPALPGPTSSGSGPSSPSGSGPSSPSGSGPSSPSGSGPSPPSGSGPPPPPGNSPNGGSGSGATSVYTGINCHIQHAARPAQICSVAGGLQYWYIGTDGSAQLGPFLPDLPKIESFSGVNPLTGKPVTIDYVTEGDKTLLRVSTYYPDNEYDTNKPYVFTLDAGHNVNHIQW